MSSNKISIPDDELFRVRDILVQTAADLGSATKEDIVQALAERDMKMDDHRLSYHIRMAEFTGTLCSGDLLPMKATYALTANKVKSQGAIDRDEALIRFTRKYFQNRQPATLEDFVWWSGLNVSDCRKGIALLGDSIHVEKWKGRSRDIVLPPEHRHHAHNNSGIFQPIIARDGIICGNWSPFREDCQADFFDGSNYKEGLQDAWSLYQRFKNK